MSYRDFFERLTGKPAPYPYQVRLAEEHLLRGRSVVLRAPTGAGKTWAVTAPFLFRLATGQPLADRMLYGLPLQSLATTLHAETAEKLQAYGGPFARLQTQCQDRVYRDEPPHCCLQIGGDGNDPLFESELVFTTIDQLLSSYLLMPVALPKRLDNINAGALIGSYLIFDEAHLYDGRTALGTVIEMLTRLKGLCQFVLMTATLSDAAIEWLCRKLEADRFDIPEAEIRDLPTQRNKQRSFRWVPRPLRAKDVVSRHHDRTIVLVNTVKRAQRIYGRLKEHYASMPEPGRAIPNPKNQIPRSAHPAAGESQIRRAEVSPRLILLHARFYPEDRKAKEDLLSEYFGPRPTRGDAILVTTQVIEAGIDISADSLLTELAPMNAIVQRAGRVARYPERHRGEVIVFDLETQEGKPQFAPYLEEKESVEASKTALSEWPEDGRGADFAQELAWVERVHGERELRLFLDQYENLFTRRGAVSNAMDEGERSALRDLVRDASSLNLMVSSTPEEVNFSGRSSEGHRIGWPRLLSVAPEVVRNGLRKCYSNLKEDQWVAKAANPADDESRDLRFEWEVLASASAVPGQWLLAVNPDFARYDAEFGLILGDSGPEPPLKYAEAAPIRRYSYQFESWQDHALNVRRQTRQMHSAYRSASRQLARHYGISPETVEELAELAALLHDVGKLSVDWQRSAGAWQRDHGKTPIDSDDLLAHTDYDPATQWRIARSKEYNLPPHAVEGAAAVYQGLNGLMANRFGNEVGLPLWQALVWSIARHHSPRAPRKQSGRFRLAAGSEHAVSQILADSWKPLPLSEAALDSRSAEDMERYPLTFSDSHEGSEETKCGWALYCHLTRRLRLSDQRSFLAAHSPR